MHGVGHKSQRGELVGELAAEEEEVGVGGVGGLEVLEGNGGGDELFLDGGKGFEFKGLVGEFLGFVISLKARIYWWESYISAVLSQSSHLVHGEEHWIILVCAVPSAMIFEYSLERYIRSVVLHQPK